jgi:hypothetical protein
MIRNALLLCAGILVATALACAPAVAPPPPPPPFTVNTVNCTSPAAFAASVQTLGANFVPDPLGPPGSAPPPGGPIANPRITTDLANAFALAPPNFLRELCGTSGNPAVSLFVQDCPAAPGICTVGSWGYRQRSTGARFIALSAGLWQGGASALPYPAFETAVINNLVGVPGLASYVSASNDSPEMTVLAVLAHELGHILFWNRSAISRPCPNPPPGVDPIFWRIAWSRAGGPPPFHNFGVQYPGDQRIRGPSKDDVRANSGNPGAARGLLQQIYGGDWAGLLANVAPDEDLIETYKLFMLNTANNVGRGPLTSLVFNIPGVASVDVIRDLFLSGDPNKWLSRKRAWVTACFT